MPDDDLFDDTVDESGRMRFHTVCPAGHPTIQALSLRELQDGLANESLAFECLYCGVRWSASTWQRTLIQSELER